jgi:hypothetical protein
VNIDWEKKAKQVRDNTREAIHHANTSVPMAQRCESQWSPPEIAAEGPPPWLIVADGDKVRDEAQRRLAADEYTAAERGLEDGAGPARQFAPLWGTERG